MIFQRLFKKINKARVVKVCEAIALQSETEICTSLLGIIIGFKQS